MEYRGYIGRFIYNEDREIFEGHVENIRDIVIFHGKSMDSLYFAFKDAIQEYIDWCRKMGREPNKPSRRTIH